MFVSFFLFPCSKGQVVTAYLLPLHLLDSDQSHYIEVVQGGVSSRARHNRFYIFSPFLAKQKFNLIFFFFIKELYCNFLVKTLNIWFYFAHESIKSSILYGSNLFFHYCQPALKQAKSHILFRKNSSLCNFYVMTLILDNV